MRTCTRQCDEPCGPDGYCARQTPGQDGADARADAITTAVWAELSRRRWFGKHVEDDELDALVDDLRGVILAEL